MKVIFIGADWFDFEFLSHKIESKYTSSEIQAKDYQEALTAIYSDPPDLIILNWRVPDTDTIDLIHEIRSNDGAKNIPLILKLVGVETEEQKQAYKSAGVDDFLPRPIRDNVLYEVLDSWFA